MDEFDQKVKEVAAAGKKLDQNEIKREMEKQFDSIFAEAKQELQNEEGLNDDEPIEADKSVALKSLSDTLNRLLERIDNLEKDVEETNQALKEKKVQLPWDKPKQGQQEESEQISENRVKVRIKGIKSSDELSDKVQRRLSTETQNIEEKLVSELKKAGFDSKGRNVQVKIITTGTKGIEGDEEDFHLLSEDETAQFTNLIVSMLSGGGGAESAQQKEANKQRKMESSYRFRWKRPQ